MLLGTCLLLSCSIYAQIPEQMIKIIVSPDHDNWEYKTGEKANFTVQVFYHLNPLKEVKAYYEIGPERTQIPRLCGVYTWGFNDETCPTTSMYAAYNLISAPKTLNLALETGHWTYPEQNTKMQNWLIEVLTKK